MDQRLKQSETMKILEDDMEQFLYNIEMKKALN